MADDDMSDDEITAIVARAADLEADDDDETAEWVRPRPPADPHQAMAEVNDRAHEKLDNTIGNFERGLKSAGEAGAAASRGVPHELVIQAREAASILFASLKARIDAFARAGVSPSPAITVTREADALVFEWPGLLDENGKPKQCRFDVGKKP